MILTVVSFIVVLGITITIHEFGHFLVAKLLRIRVLIFSLGFGPRLVGFVRGGTEYRLSPFPLGGYVKMAGETTEDERQGAPDEFLSHPRWHRFLVYLAGPTMNILLAVAILTASYIQGVYVPRFTKEPPIVGPVLANSNAKRAGLMTADRITSVHGNAVQTWEDMEIALATAPKDALDIVVQRGDSQVRLHFDPPATSPVDPASLGFKFTLDKTIIARVDPKSPAQASGLKEGDEILSVEGAGRSGKGYDEILNIISESKGIPLRFEIRRDERLLHFTITPIEDQGRVLIGFFPDIPSDLKKYGLAGAIAQSVRRNYEMSSLTFRIIGRIFTGSASVKTLSGPLEIARISGSAARTGSAMVFIGFLGLISLQLGIFNLLPIPILDGGGIALLLIEGALGRDLSLGIKEKIVQVGFVFLILLMGFVVYNDLAKIVNLDKLFR